MRAVVLWTTIAAAITAYAASVFIDPLYDARSEFYVVDASDPAGVLLAGTAGSFSAHLPSVFLPSTAEAVAATYIGILQTSVVRKRVSARVPKKPILQLENDVDVWAGKRYLLNVRVWDKNPAVAADVANAYPAALNDFLKTVAAKRAQNNLHTMRQSRVELERQLQISRNKLQELLDSDQTPSVKGELELLLARRNSIESAIQVSEIHLQGIDQRIALAEKQLAREARLSLSARGAQSSATVQRLMMEVSDLEAALAGAKAEFDGKLGAQYPPIRSLTAQLSQRKHDLEMERASLQKGETGPPGSLYEQLRREIIGYYQERTATEAEIAETRVALTRLLTRIDQQQPIMSRETQLSADVARQVRMLDSMLLAIHSDEIQAATDNDLVVVLSKADAASEPKIPMPIVNAVIATILGLIAGVYLAFAYDWLLRARRARGDAEAPAGQ